MLGVGQTGLGLFLAASAVAPDSSFVWVLAPVGIFLGMSGGNSWAVTQTVAGPRVAGRWAGVQNFVGNFAGAVAPMLTGFILGRTGRFYWPFVICAVFSSIGAISWIFIVGRVEQVDWDQQTGSRFGLAAPATDAAQP
jgi:MFS family permease